MTHYRFLASLREYRTNIKGLEKLRFSLLGSSGATRRGSNPLSRTTFWEQIGKKRERYQK